MYDYKARVARVVDGDTVHLDVDLGFYTWLMDRSVRVAHINAPELTTDAGKQAKAYAETLLRPTADVTLTSHSLDKYGRVLGTITLADGRDYGQAMIDAGYAVAYEG